MRTLSTILLICMLTLLVAASISAQWVQTSLDSGEVHCTAISGTNLYTLTGHGIYLSTNNGIEWSIINTGFSDKVVNALDVSGNMLYASIDTALYLTTDNGIGWTEIFHTGDDLPLAFAVKGVNTILGGWVEPGRGCDMCGYTGWLKISTNNGTTWDVVPEGNYYLGGPIMKITVSESSIFASGGSQGWTFIRSSDNGLSWYDMNSEGSTWPISASGENIFVAAGDNVLRSTDNGINWETVATGLSGSYISCFSVRYPNLFAGTAHGVFLTTNNGTSWTSVNNGLTDSAIVSLTVNDSFLFAGTGSGVWRRPLSEMITSVPQSLSGLPEVFRLNQNYPNPFNPTTTISYQLPTQNHVTLKVFDVLGREVTTLVNGVEEPGYKSVNFNASKLSSGVYYYRLQAGDFLETKKLLLLR